MIDFYLFNQEINSQIKYVPDVADHWQSPTETVRRGAGDCEDFAILKYYRLIASGIPRDQVALVYTVDSRGGHMAVTVGVLVLDSTTDMPYPVDRLSVIYRFDDSAVIFRGNAYPIRGRLPQWEAILRECPLPIPPPENLDKLQRARSTKVRRVTRNLKKMTMQ